MKLFLLAFAPVALACGSAVLPTVASAQDVENLDQAKLQVAIDILDMAHPEETRFEMFNKVSKQLEAQMMQSLDGLVSDPGAREIIVDFQADISTEQQVILRRHVPLLMEAWAQSYADIFTYQELQDIKNFVATETGRAFMAKSTEVVAQPTFANANQAYMNDTMTLVMDRMPELTAALEAHAEAQY